MKKRFRTAAFLVLCAMLTGILGGCGNKSVSVKDEDDESKPYNIVWYFMAGDDTSDIKSVQDEMSKYLTEKINATIELVPIDWAAYESKMNTIMASGEEFDLCFTSNWILNVSSNIDRVAFAPLDELADKYAPGAKAAIGEENLEKIKLVSGDSNKIGHYYYIPTIKDWAQCYGFVFRKDLVDKYNIDYKSIKSMDELIPALDIIKKNEPKVKPFSIGGISSPIYLMDIQYVGYPAGFYMGHDYGKAVCVPDTPEYKEACKMGRRLVEEGYAPNDAIVADIKTQRKNGDFFCWIETLKPGKAQELGKEYKHEYVQSEVTRPVMGSLAGAAMAISRTSKNPARVMKFIELYYTDPYLSNLFAYGIEDKHYEKISDKKIRLKDSSGYSRSGIQWMFGDTTKNYLLENEEDDKNEQILEFNRNAYKQPYDDLKIDTDSIKTQIATCTNVRNEFEGLLLAGSVDVDKELPKFIEKLKQSGGDIIMKKYEEASKVWLEEHPEYAK